MGKSIPLPPFQAPQLDSNPFSLDQNSTKPRQKKYVRVKIYNNTRDQVWSKEIHPSFQITLPKQQGKATLKSTKRSENTFNLETLFKRKLKCFSQHTQEFQEEKTTKIKLRSPKDKQENTKARKVKLERNKIYVTKLLTRQM